MGKIVRDATLEAQNALLTQQNNILTQIATNLGVMITSGIMLKGTIGTGGTVTSLPTSHNKGDSYIVITNGTYAGHACSVGDVLSAMDESGTTASDWAYIPNFMANSGAAKYAIENYAGSNLIGTNQTVQNAFSALNSNTWTLSKSPHANMTSGQDLDNFLTPGVYDCSSASIASSLLHRPAQVNSGFRLIVSQSGYGSSAFTIQIILIASGSSGQQREFRRAYLGTPPNGTWSAWVQLPTRAEMDNTIKSSGTGHTIIADFATDYARLTVSDTDTGASIRLNFMDNGEVSLTRYADGAWKPTTILRQADS